MERLHSYALHVQAADAAMHLIDHGFVAGVFHASMSSDEFFPGMSFSGRPGGSFWVCINERPRRNEALALLDAYAADPTPIEQAETWPSEDTLVLLPLTCGTCEQSLAGLPGEGVCPECGAAFNKHAAIDRLLGFEDEAD